MPEDERLQKVELKEVSEASVQVTVSQALDDKLVGKVLGKHFLILERIGEGGLGVVYKARHELLGTYCAIKLLASTHLNDGKALMRFQREAEAAIGLHHSHIAGVQYFGEDQETPFIVMEYVDGKPLNELLADKLVPPDRAFSILKQTAEALAYAHKQKVVHRDIKPANIIISQDEDGRDNSKIIDFGIARIGQDETNRNITQTGEVFGTPNYMSPEQCQGKRADSRSDLYSLGCVAYEMLSGAPPFTADGTIQVLMKHINEPAKRLHGITGYAGIETVVAKLMAKDPKHRYDSAEALLNDLKAIEAGNKPTPYVDLDRLRKWRPAVIGSLSVLIIAAVAAVCAPAQTLSLLERLNFESLILLRDPWGYERRGSYLLGEEKRLEAISDYTKAIELAPGSSLFYARRAEAYRRQGYKDKCMADCNMAIKLNPKEFECYLTRAELNLERYRLEQAAQDASLELTNNQENAYNFNMRAYIIRGVAKRRMNRLDEALVDLESAIKLERGKMTSAFKKSNITRAHEAQAKVFLAMGRYEEALRTANEALDLYPEISSLLRVRAQVKLASQDKKGAMADVTKALEISPENHDLLSTKARILMAMDEIEKAHQVLNQCLDLYPNCSDAIAVRGLLALRAGKPDLAVRYLKQAQSKEGKVETHREAVRELREAIELDKARRNQ